MQTRTGGRDEEIFELKRDHFGTLPDCGLSQFRGEPRFGVCRTGAAPVLEPGSDNPPRPGGGVSPSGGTRGGVAALLWC